MNIYVVITIVMLFFLITTRSHYGVSRVRISHDVERFVENRRKDRYQKFALVTIGIILVLITGLRSSQISEDYQHYRYIYTFQISKASWKEIIFSREPLFKLLMKIIGEITGYNIVIFMLVIAAVTCFFFVKYIEENATYPVFVLFLLFTIGSYYTSFNTTRQYMAVAMYTMSFEYACERKRKEYIISVLFISLFHTSALAMLPFYWVLNLGWQKRKSIYINLMIMMGISISLLVIKYFIVDLIQIYYFNMSNRISELYEGNVGLINLVRPALILSLALLSRNRLNFQNSRDTCLFNAAVYFFVFFIYACQVTLFMRFAYFFIPGSLILIDKLLDRMRLSNRRIAMSVLTVFCLLWCALGMFQTQYLFFWQN